MSPRTYILIVAILAIPGLIAADEPEIAAKRKCNVLLFSGGPSREYHFLRQLLIQEMERNEISLCIHLQRATHDDCDQGLPRERLLRQFPSRLYPNTHPAAKPEEQFDALSHYNVIIAIDPDWGYEKVKEIETWTKSHGGGLIFVAGPIHSWELGGCPYLRQLHDLLPVELHDTRFPVAMRHDSTTPFALHFRPEFGNTKFLQLNDDASLAFGWHDFFWNGAPPQNARAVPERGFYSYFPVNKIRPEARVLASIQDRRGTDLNDSEQPFIATIRRGAGQVCYLSSAEFWRLRLHREAAYQRFWLGLIDHVANIHRTQQPAPGELLLADRCTVGEPMRVEARLLDAEGKPAPRDLKVSVQCTSTANSLPGQTLLELKPLSSERLWSGWFAGEVTLPHAGIFKVTVAANDQKQFLPLSGSFAVQEAPAKPASSDIAAAQQVRLAKRFEDVSKAILRWRFRVKNGDDPAAKSQSDAFRNFTDHCVKTSLAEDFREISGLAEVGDTNLASLQRALAAGRSITTKLEEATQKLPDAKLFSQIKSDRQRAAVAGIVKAEARLASDLRLLTETLVDVQIVLVDWHGRLKMAGANANLLNSFQIRVDTTAQQLIRQELLWRKASASFASAIKTAKEDGVLAEWIDAMNQQLRPRYNAIVAAELPAAANKLTAYAEIVFQGKTNLEELSAIIDGHNTLLANIKKLNETMELMAESHRVHAEILAIFDEQKVQLELLEKSRRQHTNDLLKQLSGG